MPIPVGVTIGASAFGFLADFSGSQFGDLTPTWTDITSYVMTSPQEAGSSTVSGSWGRGDWFSAVTPSSLSFTLRNIDGRFTPGRALLADGVTANPYYPNVTYGVRVRVTETIASVTVNMFDCYVTDITAVPVNGSYWTVACNATDIMSRFSGDNSLRGFIIEESMLDSPSCLYMLQEPEGSVTFGDLTGSQLPAMIVNSKYGPGVVDAGQTPTLGLLNATVVDVTNTNYATYVTGPATGSWLSMPHPQGLGTTFTVEAWVQIPTTAPQAPGSVVLQSQDPHSASGWIISYIAPNLLEFYVSTRTFPGGSVTATTTSAVFDGNVHHIVGTVSPTATVLYLDGVSVAAVGAASGLGSLYGPTIVAGMGIPNSQGAATDTVPRYPFTGAFAFIAVYPSALSPTRVLAHYNAGANAFAGVDSTANRVSRLAGYRANTGVAVNAVSGVMGLQDIASESLGQAYLDCGVVEGSMVYVDGAGVVQILPRSVNFNPVPAVTLDASQGHVDVPTTFRDDIQLVVNDVTISTPGGADQRVTNAVGIAQNGDISQSISAPVDTDANALNLAGWMVAQGSQDQLGIPTLTVDVFALCAAGKTAAALAVLQLSPLDVVTVTNLPGVPPKSTMGVQVQGGSYSRTSESFSVSLYCIPMPPTVVEINGDAAHGINSLAILAY